MLEPSKVPKLHILTIVSTAVEICKTLQIAAIPDNRVRFAARCERVTMRSMKVTLCSASRTIHAGTEYA